MKLQTQIPLDPASNPIDYNSKILLLGSCFAENMGTKLEYYQFQTKLNPFGILFHPLAIENLVSRAVLAKSYQSEEVFEQNGRWLCFDAHSDLGANSQDSLLENLNSALMETRKWLETASHIIITLGTAWVYRNKATNQLVANCHKVPQKAFEKDLLTVREIESCLIRMLDLISTVNKNATVVFTISPVRHLKDGFVENQQSKAHLITAVQEVLSSREELKGQYFPSYEIMMDELRDYRFYGKDLVHPNELAIVYIWERFKSVWISEEIYAVMEEVEGIWKGLEHRPFNSESEAHQKFKTSLAAKITYLKERHPFMNFER
ncbi:GSCFA domain-containing protein [Flagellimonas myxillae]|uniref:GSCFA domain-containing protein n=1 Tax=Flagellimonas myxillae TaxID=2942214 RepID=UPI00201F3B8C|nr:GSCFA domain-containing protein [Muricauda myxillae]MCL6267803.1 GSCFA domain-containing protein [Muricauda myxillae]